ncbi:hypothetical protein PsYK624_141560 [Phanerochaete sordida]|uniref:Uncharacterized protein n=1 Tax=Phanerochaete sordida TaxID=48140 RepID=A0A9P3GPF2_9APHY|nr:hypothetical protein PsYK624_141560 [Phanerochaete sordida]
MPRFAAIRNVLRGSKDTLSTSAADTVSTASSSPRPSAPAPLPPVAFVSMHRRTDLISLAEAQRTPEIVYHSVSAIPDPTPEPDLDFPAHDYQLTLIPLAAAAARRDIKYRREGFEMLEARAHIAAVRAELF